MEYTAVKFKFRFEESFAADLFVAFLAENGFDSFENFKGNFNGNSFTIYGSYITESLKDIKR